MGRNYSSQRDHKMDIMRDKMKKLHSLALACIGIISITTFTNSYAQNCANSVTFSLGAGPEFFAQKRHIRNATVPFASIGYNYTDHWGLEGLWGTFKTKFKDDYNPDHPHVSGTLGLIDVLYHFSPYCFVQPFLTAGVGVTGLSPNRFDSHNEGNINAGIGLQFFANEIVAFRLDARDIYTMVGGKNDVYLNAGVTFLLDLC